MVPGAPMDDAPMQMAGKDVWLLDQRRQPVHGTGVM
jgi:hypothetical protein